MKKNILLFTVPLLLLISCGGPYQQPPVVVTTQPQQVAVQQVQPQDQYSPYQVYDNGSGGQVVYYTDPYLHTSYYLDYAIFMGLLNSGGYYGIHNYYLGHRSYLDGRYNYYHTSYHHVYYDSRSDGGRRFYTPRAPSTGYRASMPTGRTAPTVAPYRSSIPTGRPASTPSSSSSSYRSSMPSGRSSAPSSSRSSMPSGRRH